MKPNGEKIWYYEDGKTVKCIKNSNGEMIYYDILGNIEYREYSNRD